ncbi:MAG: ornithine carbamoyltransferase [Chloroflexota bacterium]
MTRHFLSQMDLSPDEVREVFERSRRLKEQPLSRALEGRTLVMFFEKPSTRTRLSFEIGMTQLGGHAVFLDRESSHLGRGESLEDTARVVSRYADVLMARVMEHQTLTQLASAATIPVINGLSDVEHPCQSMTDLFTIAEHTSGATGVKVAYVGDGANNVTHSLMLGAAQLGHQMVVASPRELFPDAALTDEARAIAHRTGGSIEVMEQPQEAVQNADVVCTDVWVSMGRESERQERFAALRPFQVNAALLSHAKSDCIFMHCLPAHIGEEVTEDVAYGPHSVIFDEAENRLHVQKALIMHLLEFREGVL